jgi:hypothetical protein
VSKATWVLSCALVCSSSAMRSAVDTGHAIPGNRLHAL